MLGSTQLPYLRVALKHCPAFVQNYTPPVGGRRARTQEGQTERGWVGVVHQMGVCEGVAWLIVAAGHTELIISYAHEFSVGLTLQSDQMTRPENGDRACGGVRGQQGPL